MQRTIQYLMMVFAVAVLLVFGAALPASAEGSGVPDRSADLYTLDFFDFTMWTDCDNVRVQDGYAYGVSPYGLMIIDLTDPTTPVVVSQLYFPTSARGAVDVSGDIVCMARKGDQSLVTVDVSDPANPFILSNCPLGEYANHVLIVEDHAFVVLDDYLKLVDITDPNIPQLIDWALPIDIVRSLKRSGSYMYATDKYGVKIIDVSIPSTPSVVGVYEYPEDEYGLAAVSEGYLYLGGLAGINVVDFSNPSVPQSIMSFSLDMVNDLAISGNTLVVSRWYEPMVLYDITNPEAVTQITLITSLERFGGVQTEGEYLYTYHTEPRGIHIWDISTPNSPNMIGEYIAARGNVEDVIVRGDYAYVMAKGFYILDISDPHNCSLIGQYFPPGYGAWDVEITDDDNYAVIADGDGIDIVDVSDPQNPVQAGRAALETSSLTLEGNLIAACSAGRQWLIDISDPTSPTIAGNTDNFQHWAKNVKLFDGILYASFVGPDELNVFIYDVHDPTQPQFLTTYNDPRQWRAWGVLEVIGNRLYLCSDYSIFDIVDVSDPSTPVTIGDEPFDFRVLKVYGDYAFIDDNSSNVRILDVYNPAAPVQIGEFNTVSDVSGFALDDNLLFVADEDALLILSATPPSAIQGDANGSDEIGVDDAVFLINYIFKGGEAPQLGRRGDANCDRQFNVADAVFLIRYIFRGGPAPYCP
jgi:hypothetical protein